jgi:hypothetical protein
MLLVRRRSRPLSLDIPGKPPLPEVKRLRNKKGTMFDVEKGGP